MSKITEYLKMIREGIPHTDQILEGVWNSVKQEFGTLSQEEQEEILKRRLICSECPFLSTNLFKDDSPYKELYNKPFDSKRKEEEFCGICSCPIKFRTSSLSAECGLSVHNEKHPDNIQELKWKQFKTK